jgi:lambda family phage portal protein
VAASFPVFIEDQLPDQYGYAPGQKPTGSGGQPRQAVNVAPGQIMYGNAGQRPHVLSSPRPGGSFPVFVERLIRAVGASVGMPYEVISKDFSQTNYSSARAALLEAWRVFGFYQRWLVDMLCRPVWSMVIEEAYLRNLIDLPKGTDFYRDMRHICRTEWIPPRRGFVDPGKEIQAYADGINNDILTLAQAITEMTGQDWETVLTQRGREEKKRAETITVRREKPTTTKPKEEDNDADDKRTAQKAG